MALKFPRCVQKALLSAGYDDTVLKAKQVISLESLYLKKDLVVMSVTKSVVLVVSPWNALMCDQISKLRTRGVEAAVLGVKKGNDADSLVISQWEGARKSIVQAGYKIAFCHPEAFLSCNDGLEVLQSSVHLSAIKAVVVDEAHCILEW